MRADNIFRDIPADAGDEIFDTLLQSKTLKIERIVSNGHRSPESGWYDQEQDEWVIVLKGDASISFDDDKTVHLQAGDYLNIPAHKKHRVTRTSEVTQTVWLAIHY